MGCKFESNMEVVCDEPLSPSIHKKRRPDGSAKKHPKVAVFSPGEKREKKMQNIDEQVFSDHPLVTTPGLSEFPDIKLKYVNYYLKNGDFKLPISKLDVEFPKEFGLQDKAEYLDERMRRKIEWTIFQRVKLSLDNGVIPQRQFALRAQIQKIEENIRRGLQTKEQARESLEVLVGEHNRLSDELMNQRNSLITQYMSIFSGPFRYNKIKQDGSEIWLANTKVTPPAVIRIFPGKTEILL